MPAYRDTPRACALAWYWLHREARRRMMRVRWWGWDDIWCRILAPWIGVVLHRVVLEFNLILDLINQHLREQDSHQLREKRALLREGFVQFETPHQHEIIVKVISKITDTIGSARPGSRSRPWSFINTLSLEKCWAGKIRINVKGWITFYWFHINIIYKL